VKFPVITLGPPVSWDDLHLFPLFSDADPNARYVPGPVAFEAGLITVDETGNVPSLRLHNRGPEPVLLIEGEMIVGASQNRVVNLPVLCPPGVIKLPVSCVERSRWSRPREARRSRHVAPPGLRETLLRSAIDEHRRSGEFIADQARVWHAVAFALRHRGVTSDTEALEDVYVAEAAARRRPEPAPDPAPGQCGVLVASGGRVIGLDLFDRPETLAAYWDGLVSGYAIDTPPTGDGADPPSAEAEAFLDAVGDALAHGDPDEAPGLGRHLASEDDRVSLAALVWDDRVVRLTASPTPSSG
jgi:hypothetical protein